VVKGIVNSVVVCAIFIFSSAAVISGPSNIPPQGMKFTPHVAQPVLKTRPVTDRSVGHAQRSTPHMFLYTATTKNKSRRQGVVSSGGVRWNCKNRRCTTSASWGKPTVQTCKMLAQTVGVIQSYGKHGAVLNAIDMRSCNAGIMVAKSKRKAKTASVFNSNLATKAPVVTPRTFARPPVRGGFAPLPGNRHVLSASPQLSGMGKPKIASRSSPEKPLPRQGGFAGLPHEQRIIKRLTDMQNKKERELERATNDVRCLSKKSGKEISGKQHHGGFAPAIKVPPAIRNHGNAPANLLRRRSGGGFVSVRSVAGERMLTSAQALEMTGLDGASAAAGGGRTVTSTQALEMTGLGAGSAAAGGGRTVTSAQALEMTGLGAGSAAAGGGRTVTSAQALEMTGLGGASAAAGGGRTVISTQALEMTGLGGASAAAGGGRTVISTQALEMTGLGGTSVAAGGGRTVTSAQALEMTGR